MKIFKNLFTAFILFTAVAVFAEEAKEEQKPAGYTFTFPDINGKTITIDAKPDGIIFKEAKGKVVLLNFFGKKCPPCMMEIPHLINLQEKYKKDFEIVALQVQDPMSAQEAQDFVKAKKINYQVADTPEMQDFLGFIMYVTKWQGMIPFMILFDENGVAQQLYQGLVQEHILEEDIQKVLTASK